MYKEVLTYSISRVYSCLYEASIIIIHSGILGQFPMKRFEFRHLKRRVFLPLYTVPNSDLVSGMHKMNGAV